MPIPNIDQPEMIAIDEQLRLRRFDGRFDFALEWYLDPETVYLVDGVRNAYTEERLAAMYNYLDAHGELYFIEILENGAFRPIGDVTFWRDDMPIVIGEPAYRGRGVGKRVVSALIRRAESLHYSSVGVDEIYSWNAASRRLFESLGFRECEKTEKGARFRLELDQNSKKQQKI